MPGMMDTILNLGLNDEATDGLGARTGNPRFAFDSYRRLIQMFGEVVEGIDGHRFESALASLKQQRSVQQDTDLSADDLRELVDDVQGDLPRGDRLGVPRRRARSIAERRPRRLQVVGQPARAGLPPCARHRRRPRHRGERRADGVRQQGRPVGHRRRVHAQSVDRRGRPVRRVPRERPGRGRRRGHPHAAADRGDAGEPAEGVRAVRRDDAPARGALPRHAGHRIHGRGRAAVSPADACGEAHRRPQR